MFIYRGKVAVGTFLCIFILSFASYYWKKKVIYYDATEAKPLKPYDSFCRRAQPTKDTFTRLKDNHSLIIAPYFDNRDRALIRVLSIVHNENITNLYCVFCCLKSEVVLVGMAQIEIHADRFDFPYGTADVVCWEPNNCSPQYMSIHPSLDLDLAQLPVFEIKNRNPGSSLREFTVCMSPMFGGYNNVLQFIQSVEMYKILGAQKVVIYKNNCSRLMEKVLRYYVSEGTIEIVQWPIDLYLTPSSHWHYSMDPKDIGYYGQIAALNDCVYHNMHRSKYVLLIDADEIILPIKDPDWKSLMKRLEDDNPDAGVFRFENHVFQNNVFASASPFNFSSWSGVPGVNILQEIFKDCNKKVNSENKKMIVRPRKVIQTSVHSVLKMYGDSVEVPSDVAILYHSKRYEQKDLPKDALDQDPTIWRYNTSLIANVNHVLRRCKLL
ncbi:glycosyltransferase family 92 protein F13G3.3-like [Sceloporus undulatus]|uniref:glycosyltransferase family 92 protein F13G3.3-like n=1 Tax=Sceloporus undulatus TaxID=8520 RepID=UPI001C4C8E2B|nr:glycosyltransferase family 92 protein F13G3.3-like [Sceloporus undulatus]XP_042335131.1 glycosyltransferase family 92 protein F13G3.3-like [Sceloporus undulatus]